MSQGSPITARRAFVQFFSMLCLVGLCAGVTLCVVKSGGNKGYVVAAMASEYYRQAARLGVSPESAAYLNALARDTMLQAIAHDPQDGDNWAMLAAILEQDSDYRSAERARALAANLRGEAAAKDGAMLQQNVPPMDKFAAQFLPLHSDLPGRE